MISGKAYKEACAAWISEALHVGYFHHVIANVLHLHNHPNLFKLTDIECCNLMNDIWEHLPNNRTIHCYMFDRLCDLCVIEEDYEGEDDDPAF